MSLTHLDGQGAARQVDVSGKPVTTRTAVAGGFIRMQPATLAALRDSTLEKGDALAVARVAGIQAAKRTDALVPLCHSLPLDGTSVRFDLEEQGVRIEAECRVTARTGVEMEALTAVSVAALTLYDMCKSMERGMVIEQVRLLHKSGGQSGDWHAD